jgi:hypothetical protein
MSVKIDISKVNPILKEFIEKETGIKLDGEISTDDLIKVYEFLYPIIKEIVPNLDSKIDDAIDIVEGFGTKRKTRIARTSVLVFCSGVRTILKCPDDDDNVTQQ